MNRIFEGEEKEIGAGELPGRSGIWYPGTRGKIRVEVVEKVTGQTLLYMMITNVNRGGVIYTKNSGL